MKIFWTVLALVGIWGMTWILFDLWNDRPRSYYVVYQYGPKDFDEPDQRWGYGWKILDFRKKFDPASDLKVVLDDFSKKENGRTVVILSWKEIEK